MARVRTFIGIEIGDGIRSRAIALQAELGRDLDGIRWENPRNFHITLVFLGDVDDRELPSICRSVAEAAASEPPVPVHVSGLGAFPNARRPRTLWAGLSEGTATLVRLHEAIEVRMLETGAYRSEERSYTPHLTLGRIREEAAGQQLAPLLPRYRDWNGGPMLVDEVVVFSSDLGRDGPVYTPLGRCELAGTTRP